MLNGICSLENPVPVPPILFVSSWFVGLLLFPAPLISVLRNSFLPLQGPIQLGRRWCWRFLFPSASVLESSFVGKPWRGVEISIFRFWSLFKLVTLWQSNQAPSPSLSVPWPHPGSQKMGVYFTVPWLTNIAKSLGNQTFSSWGQVILALFWACEFWSLVCPAGIYFLFPKCDLKLNKKGPKKLWSILKITQ